MGKWTRQGSAYQAKGTVCAKTQRRETAES